MANIKGSKASERLDGTPKDDLIHGHAGNDTLIGAAGNDLLDGGAGADSLVGGLGNDTYVVDTIGDIVLENAGEGIDTVQASVSYQLSANVEMLVLTGDAAINGLGNELDNSLVGNAADNILDGALGADTMSGGMGNDIYMVDDTGDVVVENFGEGADTVQASCNYGLGANIESLVLTGTAAINGMGNDLDNRLAGNRADNVLDSGAGADTLAGGQGNDTLLGGLGSDTYLFGIGDGHDVILEGPSNDVDVVKLGAGIDPSQVSLARVGGDLLLRLASGDSLQVVGQYAGGGVEQIQFANGVAWGSSQINGTGLQLIGTSGNDTLLGSFGSDTLQGLGGDDRLMGDRGSDTYVFGLGDGHDVVFEAANGNGDLDTVKLGAGIDPTQVSLLQSGPDLLVHLGTGEEMRIVGQYAGTGVEHILFANGMSWGAYEIGSAGLSLTGSPINDFLGGSYRADLLQGLGGDDQLNGGDGNDTLIGGDGSDTLIGGLASDRFVFTSRIGIDTIQDFQSRSDKLAFQASLRIGDGDTLVENAVYTLGRGGFDTRAELVVVTGNISGSISAANAAPMIDKSFDSYKLGDQRIFVVDNGIDTGVFLFTSSGYDSLVSATELTLLGVVKSNPNTLIEDYAFTA